MADLLLAGVVLTVILVGVWSLKYPGQRASNARLRADGCQEADIVVRQRYRPSKVFARTDVPLVLNFLRDESEACSRRVIFPDFGITRFLPDGRITSVLIGPQRKGEYLFTCEFGMYQGSVVVRDRHSPLGRLAGRGAPGLPKVRNGAETISNRQRVY